MFTPNRNVCAGGRAGRQAGRQARTNAGRHARWQTGIHARTHEWKHPRMHARTLGNKCFKWASAWQNQQNDLCVQRRLRSAWASNWSHADEGKQNRLVYCDRCIWTAAWQNKQNDMCAQRRHPPSLIWVLAVRIETFGPQLPIERTAKTLISLGGCPGWSESSLGAYVILLVLSWDGSMQTSQQTRRFGLPSSARDQMVPVSIKWKGKRDTGDHVPTTVYMSHVMRKPVYAMCEQQRRRSACASAQSNQRLWCSHPG